MEEAILQIRGDDSFNDLLAIMAFVIFANWLDGANAFQPVIPPHLNPMDTYNILINQKLEVLVNRLHL